MKKQMGDFGSIKTFGASTPWVIKDQEDYKTGNQALIYFHNRALKYFPNIYKYTFDQLKAIVGDFRIEAVGTMINLAEVDDSDVQSAMENLALGTKGIVPDKFNDVARLALIDRATSFNFTKAVVATAAATASDIATATENVGTTLIEAGKNLTGTFEFLTKYSKYLIPAGILAAIGVYFFATSAGKSAVTSGFNRLGGSGDRTQPTSSPRPNSALPVATNPCRRSKKKRVKGPTANGRRASLCSQLSANPKEENKTGTKKQGTFLASLESIFMSNPNMSPEIANFITDLRKQGKRSKEIVQTVNKKFPFERVFPWEIIAYINKNPHSTVETLYGRDLNKAFGLKVGDDIWVQGRYRGQKTSPFTVRPIHQILTEKGLVSNFADSAPAYIGKGDIVSIHLKATGVGPIIKKISKTLH